MPISKKHLKNLLKTTLAIALIYWLIASGKLDLKILKGLLSPTIFITAVALVGINLFVNSERWRQFLKSQHLKSDVTSTYKLTLIGIFFNYVIPGGVGGDVIKAYYVAQFNPQQKAQAVVTVAMDRLIGLFTMLVMALTVMIFDWQTVGSHPELKIIFSSLLVIAVLFSSFWALVFSRRASQLNLLDRYFDYLPFSEKLKKVYWSFAKYAHIKKIFFRTFFISLIAQTLAVLFFIFVGHSLGFKNVSIHTYFFVVPIGFMITAIPISPAGVGVGQAAFFYLFKLVEPNSGMVGSTAITAQQAFMFLFGLIGAFFYSTMKLRPKEQDLNVTEQV